MSAPTPPSDAPGGDPAGWRVAEMKEFLATFNVDTRHCLEKSQLVELCRELVHSPPEPGERRPGRAAGAEAHDAVPNIGHAAYAAFPYIACVPFLQRSFVEWCGGVRLNTSAALTRAASLVCAGAGVGGPAAAATYGGAIDDPSEAFLCLMRWLGQPPQALGASFAALFHATCASNLGLLSAGAPCVSLLDLGARAFAARARPAAGALTAADRRAVFGAQVRALEGHLGGGTMRLVEAVAMFLADSMAVRLWREVARRLLGLYGTELTGASCLPSRAACSPATLSDGSCSHS